jgi:hypothetical protein
MSYFHAAGQEDTPAEEFYFLVKEPHCKGYEEDQVLTIREWRKDQGIDESDEMNQEWMEIVMRRKSFGFQASLSEPAQKMFFLASTNLDKFRDFLLSSSFLDIYEVDDKTLTAIKEDDVALMKFSFKYLAASMFGTKDLKIKDDVVKTRAEQIKAEQGTKEQEALETYEILKQERDRMRAELAAQKQKRENK